MKQSHLLSFVLVGVFRNVFLRVLCSCCGFCNYVLIFVLVLWILRCCFKFYIHVISLLLGFEFRVNVAYFVILF